MKKPDKSEASVILKKLMALIESGGKIHDDVYNSKAGSVADSYFGAEYEEWMDSVNIFNERYLREYNHPSWLGINTLYNRRNVEKMALDMMLSKLRAVFQDREFFAIVLENGVLSGDYLRFNIRESIKQAEEKRGMVQMQATNRKVFIVHGHDETAILEVENFIRKLDLEPIILRDQPDCGATIIEKIEANSDVAFAVVLYTECDLGKEKNSSELKPRARQNVVFEHGYLVSKLDRKHVCALVKGSVEIPGDYSGVIFTPMAPDGQWKIRLAKNMIAVGVEIDLSKVL